MNKNRFVFMLFGGIVLLVGTIFYWANSHASITIYIVLMIIIAAILIIIGNSKVKSRGQQILYLKQKGIKVPAKIQKIVCYSSPKIAEFQAGVLKYEFRLRCLGVNPDTNKEETYVSDIMHLQPVLDLPANQDIIVYVDPQDRELYFVDISQIKVIEPPRRGGGNYESIDGKNYTKIV